MRLKNSFTKNVETFIPRDPAGKEVLFYSCGPTVYSFAHIGNFRSFLLADLLHRLLVRRGYAVRQVMNITDVGHMTEDHLADATGEDKLAKAARELGSNPYKVAEHYESEFVQDAIALRLAIFKPGLVDDPTLHPRATCHIPEMLAMIQRLLEKGFAYTDAQGQVYFEVSKFPAYGQLSGKVLEDLDAGARVAVREEKKDPRDFALWKVDPGHLMQWDPHSSADWTLDDWKMYRALLPDGIDARVKRGFPGWHIECSAMARKHLGPHIDIHTGGEDNIFPHHECEIAQSHCAFDEGTTEPFSKYWVHGRHLLVDGKKMSKRDGTFFTVKDLLDPTAAGRPELAPRLEALGFPRGCVPATVLRYALLSNTYTQPMNFSFDLLAQSKASVERIQSCWERVREVGAGDGEPTAKVSEACAARLKQFDDALDDNLNTPNALAAVFALVSELNILELTPADARVALEAFAGIDSILDVLDHRVRSGTLTKQDIATRAAAVDASTYDALIAKDPLDAETVAELVAHRQAAKSAKDFARADTIRDDIKRRGVLLDDTPQGVRWKLP